MATKNPIFCLLLVALLLVQFDISICGRFGGGGRSFSRSSYSRPSYSRPSYSSPSYSRPSYSSPSYSRPSPSYGWSSPSSRPSPSWSISKPSSPSYGWSVPSSHPSPSWSVSKPSSPSYGWSIPSSRPSPSVSVSKPSSSSSHPSPSWGVSKPSSPSYGWNIPSSRPSPSWSASRPSIPSATSRPSYLPSKPPTYGWNVPSTKPAGPPITSGTGLSSKPSSWNSGPGTNSKPTAWAIPGRESPYARQSAATSNTKLSAPPSGGTAGWNPQTKKIYGNQNTSPQGWNNKPYPTQGYTSYQPGYRPGTYGYQPAYHGYQPAYHGYPSTGGSHTIINNNYYTSHPSYSYPRPTFYTPPVYYPTYVYRTHDTGSTALGFYLGYSLGHMTTPTYHYYHSHVHDTYRPIYDHYTVHYYHHEAQSAPKVTEIQPNSIMACVGDSSIVCPPNTYALCTASGSIMCVAKASTTKPCTDIAQTNCVQTSVPCFNSTAPECRGKKDKETAEINIPCLYATKVLGNITFDNNTIVLQQPPAPPTTQNVTNSSLVAPSVTNSHSTTPQTILTTNGTDASRTKRQVTSPHPEQQFCVTIIAQPAERKNLTEGEILADETKSLFQKFAVRAFGV